MHTHLVALVLALNVLLDTAGHVLLKAGAAKGDGLKGIARWRALASDPSMLLGLVCFCGEFFVWLAFLALVPLSVGVLLGMISVVTVMVCGRLFFGERLTRRRIIGVALILLGIALVGMQQ